MAYESIVHGNDVTCYAVPVVLLLVCRKNNFTPQHGQRKESNFNIWVEISVSESVLEAAKVEQKYEKQQEKHRFPQLEEGDLRQLVKNKCYRKKQIHHNFPWATLL